MSDSTVQAPAVLMAWSVPSATDPEWFAVKRLGEALGAHEAARLTTALVKGAGVAAGTQVTMEDTAGPNLLTVMLLVTPGKDPGQVEKLAIQEIDRIANDCLSQEELDRLAMDALRRRALSLVTTTAHANIFAQFLMAYWRLDGVNKWEKAESKVTRDEVRRVAKKYFVAANRSVIVVTPAAGGKL